MTHRLATQDTAFVDIVQQHARWLERRRIRGGALISFGARTPHQNSPTSTSSAPPERSSLRRRHRPQVQRSRHGSPSHRRGSGRANDRHRRQRLYFPTRTRQVQATTARDALKGIRFAALADPRLCDQPEHRHFRRTIGSSQVAQLRHGMPFHPSRSGVAQPLCRHAALPGPDRIRLHPLPQQVVAASGHCGAVRVPRRPPAPARPRTPGRPPPRRCADPRSRSRQGHPDAARRRGRSASDRAKARAAARPIPDPAPVTITTRPSKEPDALNSMCP